MKAIIAAGASLVALIAAAGHLSQAPVGTGQAIESGVPEVSATGAIRLSRVRLATGVELEVAESGPATGRPVLMLHGFTDSWYSFSLLAEHLPGGVRAIMPSQRGHGGSAAPECCYGMRDFAADAAALLDALGIERAVVVGHSMGTLVAQHLVLGWPDRVDAVVLIGAGGAANAAIAELHSAVHALDGVTREFAHEFQASTAEKPLPPAFLTGVVDESMKVPERVWKAAIDGVAAHDVLAELRAIRVPTLLIWGTRDGVFGRDDQDALLARLSSVRFIPYEGTGHATHWEEPARVAADLAAFFRTAGAPARR